METIRANKDKGNSEVGNKTGQIMRGVHIKLIKSNAIIAEGVARYYFILVATARSFFLQIVRASHITNILLYLLYKQKPVFI